MHMCACSCIYIYIYIRWQGETGDQFFIVKEGEVECHVDGKLVKLVGTGQYF